MTLYKKIPVSERLPRMGKWVTTIDSAGELFIYARFEHGWSMRDAPAARTPDNNLPIVYWLEEAIFNQT